MRYPTCRSSADRTLCSDKFAHASSQGEEQSERCCGSRFFDPPSWFAGCGSPSLILPDNSLLAASTEGVWVKRELTVLTTRSKTTYNDMSRHSYHVALSDAFKPSLIEIGAAECFSFLASEH
ncbi:hypothetical protein AcW1_006570 [Taiwanofungus camphoratus]|nr:hypothetical protein AcV5_009156 [Antrodia cinnamomea]KAI0924447.1 hypothetical protein AcW2_005330 [Antrodia cinnamomea]KAI0954784.1 hypothetical protein AcW1_006570 [Antrodia cinnamomea]